MINNANNIAKKTSFFYTKVEEIRRLQGHCL